MLYVYSKAFFPLPGNTQYPHTCRLPCSLNSNANIWIFALFGVFAICCMNASQTQKYMEKKPAKHTCFLKYNPLDVLIRAFKEISDNSSGSMICLKHTLYFYSPPFCKGRNLIQSTFNFSSCISQPFHKAKICAKLSMELEPVIFIAVIRRESQGECWVPASYATENFAINNSIYIRGDFRVQGILKSCGKFVEVCCKNPLYFTYRTWVDFSKCFKCCRVFGEKFIKHDPFLVGSDVWLPLSEMTFCCQSNCLNLRRNQEGDF